MDEAHGISHSVRAGARKAAAVLLSVVLAVGLCPTFRTAAYADQPDLTAAQGAALGMQESTLSYDAELTFSDSAITETASGSGYSISGTALTISAAGTYRIAGTCSDGSIEVAKSLSGVTLVLDGLTLASSSTAPIVVKKSTTANIHLLDGTTSTLTDAEADSSSDTYEGACIKVKSGASVTFCGGGNLNVVANAKNGIKGGSTAVLTFNQSGTVAVSGSYSGYATNAGAVNNGIASDGSVTFNQGTFDIDAANDGIKSAPDATDETEGTTIDEDSEGAIYINGGTFDIDVDGDGVQADSILTVANGTFDIQTMNGYNTSGTKYNTNGNTSSKYTFDPDSMSCKGLKASGDRAEEAGIDPTLTVTGGSFTFNTADDAIHSDAYATVTGGTFAISSGDDGMHADTSLILGAEGGTVARDPDVAVSNSYEGLEGGTVYLYQGRYYVAAKDDGVNAAGGSDGSGSEPGGGGFNPGGGGPGGSGSGGGSFGPHSVAAQADADYNIYISGGQLYVYCDGDGLDSNGGLYLTGGMQEVFSQSSGDNSAVDADGTISISGATIFTAGANPTMDPVQASWFGSSQKYKTNSSSLSSGGIVNATLSGTVLYSTKLTKSASFFMYSAPSLSGTPTIATATSLTSCKAGSWSHSWNSGSTSDNVTTYTCTACGATETQTVATATSVDDCDHSSSTSAEDQGYTVTFAGDSGVSSITVYHTQDYSSSGTSESVGATGSTVSRDGDTGAADSTGSGQVNFQVVLNSGYTISSVTATDGTYKNIKGPSDTGQANTYRITKVTASTTVTITTEADPTYSASYAFVSGTDGYSLPDSVTALLPADSNAYADGATVTAAELSTASVAVDGGTWTFAGWDATSKTIDGADVAFTGTWTYAATTAADSVAAGATAAAVDALLTSRASDSDPAGSVFSTLRLKGAKATKTSVKLAWAAASGAEKYVVYGSKCGKANKLVKLATVTGKTFTHKKLAKATYYKYLVVALDGSDTVVSASKMAHVATKGGKVTNLKAAKLTNAKTGQAAKKATLAKGKTLKLKASVTKVASKLTLKNHRKVKWESSNAGIATVTSGGKVKAVAKGTCYVYAYAQNGVFAKCKITVK